MISGFPSAVLGKEYIGRFCAIDIGTVTCRMLIADAYLSSDGSIFLVELDKEYEVVNLGEGVDETHRLSAEALARTEEALRKFIGVRISYDSPEFPIIDTMAVATSATRDAENSDEFVALLEKFGISLNVISGDQEGALSFSGASCAYPGERVAVVDVGGGSTEISIGTGGGDIEYSHSFDIGSRRITERFWDGYPCSSEKLDEARSWAREVFSKIPESARSGNMRLIAVAGTATSVVTMQLGMTEYDASVVNGSEISLAQLESIERRLSAMSLEELQNVIGLDPRRAPVIVGGLIILEEAMKSLGANAYTASESDILEGIVMYNASHHIESR